MCVAGLLMVSCMSEPDETNADQQVSTPVFDMPYRLHELDNGLRVIIVPTDYPDVVSLRIPVQTGPRIETEAGKTGFAHFFEHLMSRGTERYSSEQFFEIMRKAGAESTESTFDDYTVYRTTFTAPDLAQILEIQADRFRNLSYSARDFSSEALAVKGEFLASASNPILKAYLHARDLAFDVHPYSHSTMGTIEDIEAMPDQLAYARQFFDRWYRPEYTSLIVVGDVEVEPTLRLIEQYWGDWERGSFEADIPTEPAASKPIYDHIQVDTNTRPWLFVCFRGPAFLPEEKDKPAIDLIGSLYFSESSDLYRELVVEKQLVDQLNLEFVDNKDPNLLAVYVRLTDEGHGAEVEAAVNRTMARARSELVSERALAAAVSRLRYLFTARLGSSSGISDALTDYVHFERTPETINTLFRTYDSLTPEDLRFYANRYFIDRSRVTVSLSGASSLDGVDGLNSIDDLVVESDSAPAESGSVRRESLNPNETVAAHTPVEIVEQPSSVSPLVDVSFLVHAGASMDPEGQRGLASLTAAMISDGSSEQHSISDINEEMFVLATGFDAQVDKEMTRLSGQMHKTNLDAWYRLVSAQLLRPAWSEADFQRVKSRLIGRIRGELVTDNDEELGKEALYVAIYGDDHPYGSPNLGNSGDVENLTLDDVKEFYASHYTIRNITVGFSGGYPELFVEQVRRDLQWLPAGQRTEIELPSVVAPAGNRATIVQKDTPSVAVSFGLPIALRRGDPDWVALWLVRSWLGEHRSASGRLYQRIRDERGMNYGDYAYIEYFPDGMFAFRPETNLGRQQQIFQVWIRPLRSNNDALFATRAAVFEIDKLIDEGMSESEFELTRDYLRKFVSLLTDGQTRQLGYRMDSQYYGIEGFSDYVRDDLDSLTLADVNRVIAEYLRTDRLHFVFVSNDANDLRQRLAEETRSPLIYDTAVPPEIAAEDILIESLPLGISDESIEIIPATEIFH